MGAALNHFINKFNEFKNLPAGESFSIQATDAEATEAAREYITENYTQIQQLIRNSAGISLDVENPEIRFGRDQISVNVRGRKGFIKVNASLSADVWWDGKANVTVRSVDIPFFSISPEKLNFMIEKPLLEIMGKVEEYAEIRSFELRDGLVVLNAVRK